MIKNHGYEIIYTDPPWQQRKGGLRRCRPVQGRELDYPTLELGEIFELHKPFFIAAAEKHNGAHCGRGKYASEITVEGCRVK